MRLKLLILFVLISQSLFSQKERRLRDFFSSPKDSVVVNSIKSDSVSIIPTDSLQGPCDCPDDFDLTDSIADDKDFVAQPIFVPELVAADSLANKDFIDSLPTYDTTYWVTVDTLYKTLDRFNVNPYGIDGLSIKDTFFLLLSDTIRFWSMPLDSGSYITSKFGPRGYRYHYGDDLKLQIGDTVKSAFDGVVRISKYNKGGYGNYVMVRHNNGLETIYGHLSERIANVGDIVKAGDCIGLGGNTGRSTGAHLHLEVRYKGVAIDPKEVFDYKQHRVKSDVLLISPRVFHYIAVQRQKVYHYIRSGDTLYGIARRYHVRSSQICRLNRITTKTTLRIGRRLRIK